jgi:hypothetical protein
MGFWPTFLSVCPLQVSSNKFFNVEKITQNYILSISVEFDKLGLTDNANPLGVLPPVLARSMGKAAGSMLGENVFSLCLFIFEISNCAPQTCGN